MPLYVQNHFVHINAHKLYYLFAHEVAQCFIKIIPFLTLTRARPSIECRLCRSSLQKKITIKYHATVPLNSRQLKIESFVLELFHHVNMISVW